MSIEREGNLQHIACEDCSASTEVYRTDEFDQMVREAKGYGWDFHKTRSGQWEHRCPQCADPVDKVAQAKRMFGVR